MLSKRCPVVMDIVSKASIASKHRTLDTTYVSNVLRPPSPWHARVLYADAEKKAYMCQISKSYISTSVVVYRYRIALDSDIGIVLRRKLTWIELNWI